MDHWTLKLELPDSNLKLDHSQRMLMLGSCFATHVGQLMQDLRFDLVVNPNGILYHPLSMASLLSRTIAERPYQAADLLSNENIWHSWQHHSSIYGLDQAEFLDSINQRLLQFKTQLTQANVLVLTFGSAFFWKHKSMNQAVVNCHKQPADLFEKQMSSTKVLMEAYTQLMDELKGINPGLQIIVTVSPVRYKRDGLVESNRSKARLLMLCEYLSEQFENVHYFPSYELVMDELRDYRFYEKDRVHPNAEAIEYVWNAFQQVYFTEACMQVCKQVKQYTSSLNHRPLIPESAAALRFQEQLEQRGAEIELLLSRFLPKPE